jgi:hypothetical protein
VGFSENNWESFEPHVQDTVYERYVEVEEKDDWLEEAELKRSYEGLKNNILVSVVS